MNKVLVLDFAIPPPRAPNVCAQAGKPEGGQPDSDSDWRQLFGKFDGKKIKGAVTDTVAQEDAEVDFDFSLLFEVCYVRPSQPGNTLQLVMMVSAHDRVIVPYPYICLCTRNRSHAAHSHV